MRGIKKEEIRLKLEAFSWGFDDQEVRSRKQEVKVDFTQKS